MKNYKKGFLTPVIILVFLLIASGVYYYVFKKSTPIVPISNIQNNNQQNLTTENKKLAESYQTDLKTYFSIDNAPEIYLLPQQTTYSSNQKTNRLKIENGDVSFESLWGKLVSVVNDTSGNINFRFDDSRLISFYKHDDSSTLIKIINKFLSSDKNAWSAPNNYTDLLKTSLTQKDIDDAKKLIDYSLAINPNELLIDKNSSEIIVDYSLLQSLKRTLIGRGIIAINRFNNGNVNGYIMLPKDNSESIKFIVFSPSGKIYTGFIYNKSKFLDNDIQTLLSTLNIKN